MNNKSVRAPGVEQHRWMITSRALVAANDGDVYVKLQAPRRLALLPRPTEQLVQINCEHYRRKCIMAKSSRGLNQRRPPKRCGWTEAREKGVPWRLWGPYLSERQWGTVREDYSENGDAWDYFTHDQARSRAYHWGEDGLAGFSDDKQRQCFAVALWNGKDPILKERLFGLTNSEGNHGEDVKEYYFYPDAHRPTPI